MTAATITTNLPSKTPGRPAAALKTSGLGLDSIGDLASLLDAPGNTPITGEPIELRIEDIEEDPHQPRETFTEDTMSELTESINLLGVKVPIAVHPHPEIGGRYIINDGARRYRAAIRAGKETIAAVVVTKFSVIEQIVVNKFRDDTPPRDKAKVFARLIKEEGWTQRQLAEKSKLSEAYISQHLALLTMPAAVRTVFDSARCLDVTVINELIKAHKRKADAVESWLDDKEQEITRGSVRLLREFLDDKRSLLNDPDDNTDTNSDTAEKQDSSSKKKSQKEPDLEKIKKSIILGTYKNRAVRLMVNKRWTADGLAWVKYEDSGEEIEIGIEQLKLNRLKEV